MKHQLVERTEKEALLLEIAWGKMAIGLGKAALPGLAKGALDKFKNRNKEKRGSGQQPEWTGLPEPKSSDLAPQTNRPKPAKKVSGSTKPAAPDPIGTHHGAGGNGKPASNGKPSPTRVQKPKGSARNPVDAARNALDTYRGAAKGIAHKFSHPVMKAAKGAKLLPGQTRDAKGRVVDSKGKFVRDKGRAPLKQHTADAVGDVLSAYEGPLRQAALGFKRGDKGDEITDARGRKPENERDEVDNPEKGSSGAGARS